MANCKRYNGEVNIQPYKKKASTAFAQGDIVYIDSSGYVDKAGASTAADDIIGVIMETILSTDVDYAVAREVGVDLFSKGNRGDWWDLTVGTGTPAQTQVGELHDLTSSGTGDVSANSVNVYKVERIISATHILVSFQDTDA